MSREIIKQLKALKNADINPSSTWLDNNRALLLSQIKNTTRSPEHSVMNRFTLRLQEILVHFSGRVLRPVAVMALVAVTTVTGWVASTRASESLPGDTLYGLKRTAEKAEVAMASVVADENQLVKLHLKLASRRADEVKEVVKKNPERKAEAQAAVKDLKQELQTANQKLEGVKKQSSPEVKNTVADLQQKTESIKVALQDVKTDLQASTSTVDKSLSAEISSVRDLTKETNLVAIQLAFENQAQGKLSQEDVTKVVSGTLQSMVVDTDHFKQKILDIKNNLLQVASSTGATSTTSASSSKEIQEKIKSVIAETSSAIDQVDAIKVKIDQKVREIKEAMEKKDATINIVDKLKEATDFLKEVEKLSNQAIEKAQVFIPQVESNKMIDIPSSTPSSTPTVSTTTTNTVRTNLPTASSSTTSTSTPVSSSSPNPTLPSSTTTPPRQ